MNDTFSAGVHWKHWAFGVGLHFGVGFGYVQFGPFYAEVWWD